MNDVSTTAMADDRAAVAQDRAAVVAGDRAEKPPYTGSKLIATFGVLLVLLLLGQALYRLTPLAIEPWRDGSMSTWQKVVYVLFALFNAYAEGYRGFHKRFSPRVVARAFHLGQTKTPLHVVLALPFCMSLFHSTKRQKIVSWTFVIVIVAVIVAVRQLAQPWRGIIDGGVVVGLALGALSVVYFWLRGLAGTPPPATDLPN